MSDPLTPHAAAAVMYSLANKIDALAREAEALSTAEVNADTGGMWGLAIGDLTEAAADLRNVAASLRRGAACVRPVAQGDGNEEDVDSE